MSLEPQHIECALKHSANDLYAMADRGHILIIHGLILSYHTSLQTVTNKNKIKYMYKHNSDDALFIPS